MTQIEAYHARMQRNFDVLAIIKNFLESKGCEVYQCNTKNINFIKVRFADKRNTNEVYVGFGEVPYRWTLAINSREVCVIHYDEIFTPKTILNELEKGFNSDTKEVFDIVDLLK